MWSIGVVIILFPVSYWVSYLYVHEKVLHLYTDIHWYKCILWYLYIDTTFMVHFIFIVIFYIYIDTIFMVYFVFLRYCPRYRVGVHIFWHILVVYIVFEDISWRSSVLLNKYIFVYSLWEHNILFADTCI